MKVAVSRAPGAERVVTPLELFFDLVYVFALGQLSHHLLEHVDLRTAAETVILALAVVYGWYMTAWAMNWLEPDRLPVRVLLVGLMFASLLMSVAIGDAFDGRAWLFVSGYLAPSARTLGVPDRGPARAAARRALRQRPRLGPPRRQSLDRRRDRRRRRTPRALGARGRDRLQRCIGAALAARPWPAIDLGHADVAGAHLIERFRLFFLIALGETVITMGTAFTNEPFELERLLALAIAFTGTVALWWCYFQRSEAVGAEAAGTAEGAGAVGYWGTWTLTLIVLALIGIAVGDELAIAHPDDDATSGFTILTFGGPALFLLAQIIFRREAVGDVPRSRLLGLAALAILAVVTSPLTMIVGITASSAVLVAVAIADTVGERDRRRA